MENDLNKKLILDLEQCLIQSNDSSYQNQRFIISESDFVNVVYNSDKHAAKSANDAFDGIQCDKSSYPSSHQAKYRSVPTFLKTTDLH